MTEQTKKKRGTKPRTDAEFDARFWSQVRKTESCWIWTGCQTAGGYGAFNRHGIVQRSHRYSYEKFKGPIPDGLHIDHLCRVRQCVNPDHLEAVTNRENWRRGFSASAISVATNKCIRGHDLSGENLYIRPDTGARGCLTCRHENWRVWYAESGAAKAEKDRHRKGAQSKGMEAV